MPTSSAKILVTGGHGQLGKALCAFARNHALSMKTCSRQELDITNKNSIKKELADFLPNIVINAAAYTAVDKAEQEKEAANNINHLAVKHLAELCHEQQIPLIHVSTDYVFSGEKTSPYHEDDSVNPINFYGETKHLGEEALRKTNEQHIILRTSGVFSEYGHNFMKTILRLAQEKNELRIVADQITCPTYACDLAETIMTLAKKCFVAKKNAPWGTYHYCNTPPTSWYEFACAIEKIAKNKLNLAVKTLTAITTAEYPTLAKRPAYSALDCTKIQTQFGIIPTSWHAGIKQALEGIMT